jgi:VanZ family protein
MWTLVVVAAIYSTLGLAATLADEIQSGNLFGNVWFIGFLLLIPAVVVQALKQRPGGVEIGVGIGVLAVYMMTAARIAMPAERTHLFEYGLVAALIYQALAERRNNGRHVPWPAALAVAITAVVGWIDEGIQAMLPNRVYDLRDVGVNALAGLMAVMATVALTWARHRRESRSG